MVINHQARHQHLRAMPSCSSQRLELFQCPGQALHRLTSKGSWRGRIKWWQGRLRGNPIDQGPGPSYPAEVTRLFSYMRLQGPSLHQDLEVLHRLKHPLTRIPSWMLDANLTHVNHLKLELLLWIPPYGMPMFNLCNSQEGRLAASLIITGGLLKQLAALVISGAPCPLHPNSLVSCSAGHI